VLGDYDAYGDEVPGDLDGALASGAGQVPLGVSHFGLTVGGAERCIRPAETGW
jgi:hypothetical protein